MNAPAVPLHGYQRRWLQDRSRWKIGMFARQTGKTFATTLEIVDSCYQAAAEGRRERWVILSRGERQAAEAMSAGVQMHAAAYGLACEVLASEFVSDDETRYRQLDAVLPGGSRITALPANPDTARGFSANVFLDEFAFHQDSRRIWAALFPVISAGHRLRITSTPNGKGNRFYELMTGTDSTWSRHEVDIYAAVADGLPRDVDEMREALGDDDVWAQEYECEWADGASAWLPYDLIAAAEHPDAGDPEKYLGGVTTIGNDIARVRDLWVAWVLEEIGDVLWTREILEMRGATFAEQDAAMDGLMRRYPRTRRVAMDQTGMGEKPVEDAKRRYGEYLVEGVLFTAARRLDLAHSLRERIEDRQLRLPAGNRALRTDLHGVKRVAGPTGAPRLVVQSDDGADSHSDRFWAGAMATAAADAGASAYGYRPVVPEPATDGRGWRERPDHSGDARPRGSPLAGRFGHWRGAP